MTTFQLTTRNKIIIVTSGMILSFAAGRWLTPVKIKTETKIVTIEKKVEDKKISSTDDKHIKTTITEVHKPDGTQTKTTVTEDTSVAQLKVDDNKQDDVKSTSDTTKTITKESSKLHISALLGVNVLNPSSGLSYGALVSKDIVGPLNIGLFGLSTGQAGASVGVSF